MTIILLLLQSKISTERLLYRILLSFLDMLLITYYTVYVFFGREKYAPAMGKVEWKMRLRQ